MDKWFKNFELSTIIRCLQAMPSTTAHVSNNAAVLLVIILSLLGDVICNPCRVCTISSEYNYFHPGETRHVIKVRQSKCFKLVDDSVIRAASTFYVKVEMPLPDVLPEESFAFVLQDDLYCEHNCCPGFITNTPTPVPTTTTTTTPTTTTSTTTTTTKPITTTTTQQPSKHFALIPDAHHNHTTPAPRCVDNYNSCSALRPSICVDIESWARKNCAKYCSFCTGSSSSFQVIGRR